MKKFIHYNLSFRLSDNHSAHTRVNKKFYYKDSFLPRTHSIFSAEHVNTDIFNRANKNYQLPNCLL
jgi:hypothetical protein